MPSKHALSVPVTERLASFIRQQVDGGRYGSASEVVRAGLRLLEEQSQLSALPVTGAAEVPTSPKLAAKRAKTRAKA
ncbi:Type II toxin-antitoxin system ParD family antitoxin [Burkholderia sp. 8Y]|uniref:type II toxin-antitoxin system ParD family antitoxin n=1 Tax=Burkholderia sp. 8Y TaxID=2653133 RepID=UPI0012F3C1B0|nr:type II toxin-antitoxin system ParD family antitoxin [Burkholderia sp. 8Y]VXC90144.1 Type II toxin-antitoxin system ParD family antitoxin [Burkholderia sp. 8Y]